MRPFPTLLSAGLLVLLLTHVSLAELARPDFTGEWRLNEKLSDPLQPARPGNRPAGDRRGGRGGRRGDGGGGERRAGGDGQPGSSRKSQTADRRDQPKVRLLQAHSHLTIFHEGSEFNLTNGLDISQLLFTDGRETTTWTDRGEAKATAVWADRDLVVRWADRQGKVARVRRYTLSADRHRLTVTEKQGPPGSDNLRETSLVYDRLQ